MSDSEHEHDPEISQDESDQDPYSGSSDSEVDLSSMSIEEQLNYERRRNQVTLFARLAFAAKS